MQNVVMLNNFSLFFYHTPLDKQFFVLCKKPVIYIKYLYIIEPLAFSDAVTTFLWMFCFFEGLSSDDVFFSQKKKSHFIKKENITHLQKTLLLCHV